LFDLPGAEAEAVEIARLYPGSQLLTGSHATRAAFLEGAKGRTVVHYAGHAVSSAAPASARLIFAGDTQGSESLFLQKLDRQVFSKARVVVLAACRTAAGSVSRVEGPLSLGRPFLAAGVPSVVASLWDIDDGLSRRFFVAFHRLLITEGDSAAALREAQIAHIRSGDAVLAHPASWAPFISIGGMDVHSLSRGESS
jgi:CHAT domain-containing protein